jgi:hypothetical protein
MEYQRRVALHILVFPAHVSEGTVAWAIFLGQVRKMILRIEQQPSIDNMRNYPAEAVDQLGKLLVEGASAREDPRRKNFYDVEHADRTFFIHVSPSSGRVMSLATWERLLRAGFASFEEDTEAT